MRAPAASPPDLCAKAPAHPDPTNKPKHHRRRRRHSIHVASRRAAATAAPDSALPSTPPPAPGSCVVVPMPRRLTASQRRLSHSASLTSMSLTQCATTSPTKQLLHRSAEPAAARSFPIRADAPSNQSTATVPLMPTVRELEKQPKSVLASVCGLVRPSSSPSDRTELPILRSKYVARNVRTLIGTRWKLSKFATKTVVLLTNGSSSMCGAAAALPVLRVCSVSSSEVDVKQFTLALNLKCVQSGSRELKLKSIGGSDPFRMKIRFVTAADAEIWLRVLHDTLEHARWVCDVEERANLAKDATSSVRVVHHTPSKQEFVIKVLPGVRVDDMLNSEILVLKKLFAAGALPHIREYRVVETFTDTCIVMPKFPGRNLLQFLHQKSNPRHHHHKLSEEDARAVMRGVCDALFALHDVGIVHCDLKLENILLEDVSDVQVIDFGGAFDTTAIADSYGYIAPERILFVDSPPTPAADVFSAGIVLFQMLTGRQPFVRPSRRRALSIEDTTVLHWHVAEKILSHHGVSAAAKALIERMVDPDPQSRITIEQVMRDPWLLS